MTQMRFTMIGSPIPMIEPRRRTIPLLQILSILRIALSSRGVEGGGGGAPPDAAAAAVAVEHPNCRLFLAESTIPNGANDKNNARLRRDATVGSVSLRLSSVAELRIPHPRPIIVKLTSPRPPHPHFSSPLPPPPSLRT